MSRQELEIFEDDPGSQAGATALEELDMEWTGFSTTRDNVVLGEKWGLEPDSDPRVVATRAEISRRRTLDAYVGDRAGWWQKNEPEPVTVLES